MGSDNAVIVYKELYAHYLQESVSLREQLVQAQLRIAELEAEDAESIEGDPDA